MTKVLFVCKSCVPDSIERMLMQHEADEEIREVTQCPDCWCQMCQGSKVLYHGGKEEYDIEPCPSCQP
jgi:hypothetical protein